MRPLHGWLFGTLITALLAIGCQSNSPLEPYLERETPLMEMVEKDPIPPDIHLNYGECVGQCQDKRHRAFQSCLDSGGEPDRCAAKTTGDWRICIGICHKNCEKGCEEERQAQFQKCIVKDDPSLCADEANVLAKRCKARCKKPMMK